MALFWLGLKTKWFELAEFIRVLWRFRASWLFIRSYLQLKLVYLLDSPYQVSKRFLFKSEEADLYQYGETPLSVFADIIEKVGIDSDEHVYELGSGSGFCALWLATFVGVQATAVELIPVFCRRLERVQKRIGVENLRVSNNDYFHEILKPSTLIYLYASNLDDVVITELAEKLTELPEGARVLSVSYSLADYDQQNAFEVLEVWQAMFPWGEAEVYLQIRTADRQKSGG
ncbi:hypothetical protein EOPP23_03735 [Endozoicomonas sp. OPT23]|uniref:SAM-dependent methyltransferase n=1 Tax=Endozoicomonas sp. OPT23 TaxID=2072845 RepID=UPI00129ACBE3|nr:hypothetical protein [Endozoicomonas sp. OPT23]MRI32105.1 hypothetical protein [Endozoicomonas sp. OPT23]